MRAVRLIAFAVFSYLLFLQVAICVLALKQGLRGAADFRHLYTAGYLVRTGHGHDLYNFELEGQLQNAIVGPEHAMPFDHLAYEALLFAPFSLLKYSTAYLIFAGLNVLLLVAAQRFFRPYLAPLESLGKFVPEAMFFCFLPTVIAIILGQDSIILLALAVGAFIALERGCELRSGFLLSLGFFKFQFVLPVILLFLIWRRWRFVLGAVLGAAAAISASVWIAGGSGMLALARTLGEMSVGLTNEAQKWKYGANPSVMPNLRGFIDTTAGSHLSPAAIQMVVALCSLLVILIASRKQPSLPLAILVAVLVSYHGLIHDASLVALPLGIFLVRAVSGSNLLLGAFGMVVFAAPAALFEFSRSRYFPIAILLFILLLLWRRRDARAVGLGEAADSGSASQKLLA
jgi:Glycosyltransferase family 87